MIKENQYNPQSRPHPSETLAEKLAEMAMGPKEFALRTGKPEKTINTLLKGECSITPDMAVLFENVTKIPASFWINHQRAFDEYIARIKRQAAIDEAITWAKCFPLSDMIKMGWIPKSETLQQKTLDMLAFFGFSQHAAWEEYYFKQQLKVAFRISLSNTNEPYAISAWLRKGELQALELKAQPYSEKKFKDSLPKLKSIMAKHPKDFFNQLQQVCQEAGVKVVHTPCVIKAPISGATRWLNDTPLIQLSARYKRNDSFWFTFFHEAGHIILHGKKDIFLEKVDYSDKDLLKEKEANDFAVKWTLTQNEELEITSTGSLNLTDIISFAKQFNTHPAIIIGRLQHNKHLPFSFGREFLKTIDL